MRRVAAGGLRAPVHHLVWLLAVVAVAGAPAGPAGGVERTGLPRTPDEAVAQYLQAMASGDTQRLLDTLVDSLPGIDPGPAEDVLLPLEEAESAGVLAAYPGARLRAGRLRVLSAQREFVLQEFGPSAWEEAAYTLQPVPAPEVAEYWVDRRGNPVPAHLAEARLADFWQSALRGAGVDPALAPGPRPPAAEVPAAPWARWSRQARAALAPLAHEAPVRVMARPKYDMCLVRFRFAGSATSASGYRAFSAVVSNRTGHWKVALLQWEPPLPDPAQPVGD